jgi:PKD repeat protein
MAHNPNAAGVEVFVNDVGQNNYEEINRLVPGADYGWNLREGPCVYGQPTRCGAPPAGLTDPIYSYPHDDSMCNAITGGAFVPNGVWSSQYWNDYLYADYTCGSIFRLEPNGQGGFVRSDLVTGLGRGSAVHLQFGSFGGGQALYYTVFGTQGQIRRLSFTTGNVEPTAVLEADPTSGDAPLLVEFDARGSFDPEGGALTYLWDFGDGTTDTTSTPVVTHTYAEGPWTATLRVRDPGGVVSSPTTAFISSGNAPPQVTIVRPSATTLFRVGQRVNLSATATDPEDGTLPPPAFTWTVLRHHNDHSHPLLLQTGNDLSFVYPPPEDIPAASTSYVEVIVEATDSGGLSSFATRNAMPRKIRVTLATSPNGRRVRMNGEGPFIGPTTVTGWTGWRVRLNALTPQDGYVWTSWSDGGAAIHTVTLPSTNVSYTARYRRP